MVAYLASAACTVTGEAFSAGGGRYARVSSSASRTAGSVPTAAAATADDIEAHLDDIEDVNGFTRPGSAWDELRDIGDAHARRRDVGLSQPRAPRHSRAASAIRAAESSIRSAAQLVVEHLEIDGRVGTVFQRGLDELAQRQFAVAREEPAAQRDVGGPRGRSAAVAELDPGDRPGRQAPDVVNRAAGTVEVEDVEEDACVRFAAHVDDSLREMQVREPTVGEELQADVEPERGGAPAQRADRIGRDLDGEGTAHVVGHVDDRRAQHRGRPQALGRRTFLSMQQYAFLDEIYLLCSGYYKALRLLDIIEFRCINLIHDNRCHLFL